MEWNITWWINQTSLSRDTWDECQYLFHCHFFTKQTENIIAGNMVRQQPDAIARSNLFQSNLINTGSGKRVKIRILKSSDHNIQLWNMQCYGKVVMNAMQVTKWGLFENIFEICMVEFLWGAGFIFMIWTVKYSMQFSVEYVFSWCNIILTVIWNYDIPQSPEGNENVR